ncbi:amino acid adenylation domain-containing protein [Streptomyces sp. BBFR2]|uniref:amino acid adenylation domain-containing protein n=1 Tax=Streptomyces sp. BBFR2 TaxID=3372854 RepID=UPI0037D9DDEA
MSELNRPDSPNPHSDVTLTSLFLAITQRFPDHVAVRVNDDAISYADLQNWSLRIADHLRDHGVSRGARVALRLPAGMTAIAALLGILRVGAAYVPLDVRNPPARNTFIVADSQAAALIGDIEGLEEFAGPILTEAAATALRTASNLPDREIPDAVFPEKEDTAYIIYTSGTTGKPKGVPVRHASAVALFDATRKLFDFSSSDRWLLFHSMAFDFSVWEIWGALTTGAELVVLPYWTARVPAETARFVRDNGITVLNQTPTAFGALASATHEAGINLPDLRYVIFGGEKFTPSLVQSWAKEHGLEKPCLVNMYGITETTVHATFHQLVPEDLLSDESVIGNPLPGFSYKVVAEDGSEVAPGETGELLLAGPQVSHGYLNRPELTAQRFTLETNEEGRPEERRFYHSGDLVASRPDGSLVYHGRADLQVKLRGHRIELSDVESAVRSNPNIADAVVWVREYGPTDSRLVCAYTVTADRTSEITTRGIREFIRSALPSYMHPSRYLELPDIPLTINGKADRAAVARVFEERQQSNV